MRSTGTFCALFLFVGVLSGCQKYHASPLVPHDVVNEIERIRRDPDNVSASLEAEGSPPKGKAENFTFARAVNLMNEHSPALRELRAEYQTALALAKVKTPLPNPTIEAGPNFGFGPDVMRRSVEPFGSIGFAIPIAGRLKRQDEVNKLSAALSYVETEAKHRELYLDLRRLYSRFVLARVRLNARKSVAESAAESAKLTKRLVEAGQSTTLDLGILELDSVRMQSELLSAENELALVEGELSQLIGVHTARFQVTADPELPEKLEAQFLISKLHDLLVNNNPLLARLRARYEVADAELRLELAKQYPDFRFGPSAQGDINDRKTILGLTLGIDIPLFNTNQQAVATSVKRREEIRAKYEAAANKALATLDRSLKSYTVIIEKLKLLNTLAVPKAHSNVQLAKKSLEAGASDSLRFLETQRSQRLITIDAIDTDLAAREALIEIEQAIGYPLLQFPSEQKENFPPLPDQHNE